MSEKIAFASWNYIRLLCSIHKTELILDEVNGRPVYRCEVKDCHLKISSALYEKVLDDVISLQNNSPLSGNRGETAPAKLLARGTVQMNAINSVQFG